MVLGDQLRDQLTLLALTPALDLQLLSERHHLSRVHLFDLLARFAVCGRRFGVSLKLVGHRADQLPLQETVHDRFLAPATLDG
jgi:hypothetical protein